MSIEKKYREEDSLMSKQFRGLGEIYSKESEKESQFSIEKKEHSVPSKGFEQNLLPEVTLNNM